MAIKCIFITDHARMHPVIFRHDNANCRVCAVTSQVGDNRAAKMNDPTLNNRRRKTGLQKRNEQTKTKKRVERYIWSRYVLLNENRP